ncbi:unnamed protein product, partial [Protopolystoma xenopodis]
MALSRLNPINPLRQGFGSPSGAGVGSSASNASPLGLRDSHSGVLRDSHLGAGGSGAGALSTGTSSATGSSLQLSLGMASSPALEFGHCRPPTSLYILGEEKMMKKLAKSDNFPGIEFFSVDYVNHSAIAASFETLFNACLPKDRGAGPSSGAGSNTGASSGVIDSYDVGGTASDNRTGSGASEDLGSSAGASSGLGLGSTTSGSGSGGVGGNTGTQGAQKNIHVAMLDCGWLEQLQSLLQLAGAVVDLLDLQGASCALCLEDGRDSVAQVTSLAQIMLDQEYRTLAGFWSLIHKEWLLFGHPFTHRLGQNQANRGITFSPVFLQFLDAVHQLLLQFPMAFEFNDFFLRFLAFHHLSNRFADFKFDTEADRLAAWFTRPTGFMNTIITNEVSGAPGMSDLGQPTLLPQHEPRQARFSVPIQNGASGTSLSAGASRFGSQTSLMRRDSNSLESEPGGRMEDCFIWNFIRAQHREPSSNLFTLDVWGFFIDDDLATGPVYDLDHFCPSYRKKTNRPYEPVLRQGFNNSHIEHTYAVLGLREGDEAGGWLEAWRQAQFDVLGYSHFGAKPTHQTLGFENDMSVHSRAQMGQQNTPGVLATSVNTSCTLSPSGQLLTVSAPLATSNISTITASATVTTVNTTDIDHTDPPPSQILSHCRTTHINSISGPHEVELKVPNHIESFRLLERDGLETLNMPTTTSFSPSINTSVTALNSSLN